MAPECIPEVVVEIVAAVRRNLKKDVAKHVEHVSVKLGVGNAREIAHGPKSLNKSIWKSSYHRRKCNRRNNIAKFSQI